MNTIVKAAVMKEWAVYLFKLAVLRDLFEIQEIGDRLRAQTEFKYSNSALGQYFKGIRKPPPDFFDYVREALELDNEEYQTLLFLYHSSKPQPTPLQREQMQHFKSVLLERMIQNLRQAGEGNLGGAAS